MNTIKSLLAGFVLLVLTACSGMTTGVTSGGAATAGPDYELLIAEQCASYGSALQTLAAARARGELDTVTRAKIAQVRKVADPICTAEPGTIRVDEATLNLLRPQVIDLLVTIAGDSR